MATVDFGGRGARCRNRNTYVASVVGSKRSRTRITWATTSLASDLKRYTIHPNFHQIATPTRFSPRRVFFPQEKWHTTTAGTTDVQSFSPTGKLTAMPMSSPGKRNSPPTTFPVTGSTCGVGKCVSVVVRRSQVTSCRPPFVRRPCGSTAVQKRQSTTKKCACTLPPSNMSATAFTLSNLWIFWKTRTSST